MKAATILILLGTLKAALAVPQFQPFDCLQDINGNCIDPITTSPPIFPCFQYDTIFVESSINQITVTIDQCQQFCKSNFNCKVCISNIKSLISHNAVKHFTVDPESPIFSLQIWTEIRNIYPDISRTTQPILVCNTVLESRV